MLEARQVFGPVRLAALAAAACWATASCGPRGSGEVEITPETVVADGSSTVYPITREAARRFMRADRDASVAVRFSGTVGGFRKFVAGETDIENASRPIREHEAAAAAENGVDYIELPLANDALAVVVHPDNDWVDHLTLDELKRIWSPASEGEVMRWSDVRPGWPDRPIRLFGRGKDSGTFEYFTENVVGEAGAIRGDYFASEDEEILAEKIAADPGATGFFGIGAYHRHWEAVRLVAVDSGGGPIYPSLETVKNGTYRPLTRPLFLYVNTASLEAKPALLPFLRHYYGGIREWLPFTGYLPLKPGDYDDVRARLEALQERR